MNDDEQKDLTENLKRVLEVAAALPVMAGPKPKDPDNQVWIYAAGAITCSVCAPGGMDREVVSRQVNSQHPTGISSKWQISDDTHFKGGEPMPCACDYEPGRKHWLLHC